jgi:hypothetical protein
MEAYDFKGKTVIPFATSGGSSIKTGRSSESHPNLFEDGRVVTDEDEVKACEDLKAAYPDVNWKEGRLLNRASKKDMENWTKNL